MIFLRCISTVYFTLRTFNVMFQMDRMMGGAGLSRRNPASRGCDRVCMPLAGTRGFLAGILHRRPTSALAGKCVEYIQLCAEIHQVVLAGIHTVHTLRCLSYVVSPSLSYLTSKPKRSTVSSVTVIHVEMSKLI
jgi:hypothetical protein